MQVLITTGVVAATNSNAIYLPYDTAPVPFGDPLACSVTFATPTVVTVPGYKPTNGDAVSFSVAGTSGFLASVSGLSTLQFQANTTYYVSSASGATFTLSTQKASAATPAGVLNCISTLGQLGGQPFVHLLSNQPDGPTLPFKPGNTVLGWNGGINTISGNPAAITLFGANDVSSILATGSYGAPLGPNGSATTGWAVIATIGWGTPKLLTLNYDWIVASGSTATLIMLQN